MNYKTSIPPFRRELHDNYRSTDYACQNYRLRPGLPHPGFDSFLTQNGWRPYAFVTAWNPFSVRQLPLVENRIGHARLQERQPPINCHFFRPWLRTRRRGMAGRSQPNQAFN